MTTSTQAPRAARAVLAWPASSDRRRARPGSPAGRARIPRRPPSMRRPPSTAPAQRHRERTRRSCLRRQRATATQTASAVDLATVGLHDVGALTSPSGRHDVVYEQHSLTVEVVACGDRARPTVRARSGEVDGAADDRTPNLMPPRSPATVSLLGCLDHLSRPI
jgi:hypothetical protein